MSAIRALLTGSIDYAGLFPPAGLDMASAVENYARYRAGPDAWAAKDAARTDPRSLINLSRARVSWGIARL